MKIAIGNDHAGPDYKHTIVAHLKSEGHEVLNFGTDTLDSVDYPCLLYTSPSPRDQRGSRMPSSA